MIARGIQSTLSKALFIGFPRLSQNNSRWDLNLPPLHFPTVSFDNFSKTIGCWMIDWTPTEHSLKTSLVSFGWCIRNWSIAKVSSTSISCTTLGPGFPNPLQLPNPWPMLSRSPPLLLATSFLGSSMHFGCQTLNWRSTEVWHYTASSQNPRSSVVEPLTKGQPKVELHISLVCTSCLWSPKSLPKSSLFQHFICFFNHEVFICCHIKTRFNNPWAG